MPIGKGPPVKLSVRQLDAHRPQAMNEGNQGINPVDILAMQNDIGTPRELDFRDGLDGGELLDVHPGPGYFICQLSFICLKANLHGIEAGRAQGPDFFASQADRAGNEV
jgi:hypothetical protein